MKEEKFHNSRKRSHRWVCGEGWNLRGQHNWEKKKKKPTEYTPTCNCQQRRSPDAHVCRQPVEGGQGGAGCNIGA